jgi:glycosyltransferase involved in cell wall biosynthesis
MRLTCLIDNIGSGGAQRQLCNLAGQLQRHSWETTVLTYHEDRFFLPLLEQSGVGYVNIPSRRGFRRIFSLRRFFREFRADVVLAFQNSCGLYAELASLPWRSWGLVVSERSAVLERQSKSQVLYSRVHALADYITTNSHTNRLLLERAVPRLKNRLVTIYNAVDLDTFAPEPAPAFRPRGEVRLLGVGSYRAVKNIRGVVEALARVRRCNPATAFRLDWYGAFPQYRDGTLNREYYRETVSLIAKHGLEERIALHLPTRELADLYRRADGVVMSSFYEGLPNTVCEAMASGRPVLCSNVCDAENLVHAGENGFLFDPAKTEEIAETILRFSELDAEERQALGRRGRIMAERMFAPELVTRFYADVLEAAAQRQAISFSHWIPEVPASAYHSLELSAS